MADAPSIDWTRFADVVAAGEHLLLTSHMRPDCDSLGSELGMAAVLEAVGKQVTIVNGDATPRHLRFIDPGQRIKVLGDDVQADRLEPYDVLLILDTSAWIQLGPMADVVRTTTAKKVIVDHHVSADDLGAESFKDTEADSTGRIVVEAADALGVPLTRDMAEPLFTAMATDTGWFRFASVQGDTLRVAGRLIDAGADPPSIYAALYEQDTLARVLLRGKILATTQVECGGRLAYAEVTQEDFRAVGAEPGDTEDVINMLLAIVGTEAALLFTESSDGKIKVSFRSRSELDVRQVAEQFGGGGHTMAAGATLEGPLAVARERILDAVRRAMA